mmetsp:Transcript_79038/g.139538  ORF Transcript_79038/g.139538 Transcript_79038/m.139538 type:complete len:87 (+) Transcript_79038:31-291(+)
MPVLSESNEQEDLEAIHVGFETFDAENCECFESGDKDQMLGIIHAAFGGLQEFNRAVQQIFVEAGWCVDEELVSDMATDSESSGTD